MRFLKVAMATSNCMYSRQKITQFYVTFRFTAFSNNNFAGHVKMEHEFSEVIRIKQLKMSSTSQLKTLFIGH